MNRTILGASNHEAFNSLKKLAESDEIDPQAVMNLLIDAVLELQNQVEALVEHVRELKNPGGSNRRTNRG